jgi:hypothetical protein
MVLDFTEETVNKIITAPYYRAFEATYTALHTPVTVKVYDPVKIKDYKYQMKFDGISSNSYYVTSNLTTQTSANSDYSVTTPNEQVYPEWGIASVLNYCFEPGNNADPKNGFLEATIEYSDPSAKWLSGVKDVDNAINADENWIRSGVDPATDYAGLDNNEVYESLIDGTWAPYKLTAKTNNGPKWSGIAEPQITLSPYQASNTSISNIDIVFTSDKSKWTRAAVLETGSNQLNTIGAAKQFDLRLTPSIGKNGEPDNSISSVGMSWFPGYAYNLETGERLNIAFGENSSLIDDNSQDMKFNPTSRMYDTNGNVVFGGMHYVYIFGHNGDSDTDVPMYDSCRHIATKLLNYTTNDKRGVWKHAMYCSLPLVANEFANLNLPDQIPSDVKIRIRVGRNFKQYATSETIRNITPLLPGVTYYVATTPVIHNGITYATIGESFVAVGTTFTGNGTLTATNPKNNFNPMFTFGTENLAAIQNNVPTASDALQMINVVPNPYYAFSAYETSQLDNRIKVVNLPSKCTVSIFTPNGVLVRKFKRDVAADNSTGSVESLVSQNTETSLDWDLKNQKGIPIASGVYLIHVDAGQLGQRTLKWFGMIRPIDLDTF